jgi:two-component system, OmpR family, response regulator
MKALIVEDDPRVVSLLKRALEREGYETMIARDGNQGLSIAADSSDLDVIVLDVMLPGLDGIGVCRRLRSLEVWTPILMLTAKGELEDRVNGLDAGADDYLPKPFSLLELYARLRAISRRRSDELSKPLVVGDLVLDPVAHSVTCRDEALDLTPKEFELLQLLMEYVGHALSRRFILDHVWDFAVDGGSNVVDVYIRYLREKIDRPLGRQLIETVRGVGYRLKREQAAVAAS